MRVRDGKAAALVAPRGAAPRDGAAAWLVPFLDVAASVRDAGARAR